MPSSLSFLSILEGESGVNQYSLTLDASQRHKTGSDQKVEENKPVFFFNFELFTCATLKFWTTWGQVTLVGKKLFENISQGRFS